jgi:glycyl-tRNA synthetase
MNQGWVECVGHADRSAFDLTVHTKATKVDLIAREIFDQPREMLVVTVKANKGLMGKHFKLDNAAVQSAIEELSADVERSKAFEAELAKMGAAALCIDGGRSVQITREMLALTPEMKRVSEQKYVPNVIEPSFGIGRIITGLWEHVFYTRKGDEQRAVLALPPRIAPYKAVLLPLDGRLDAATHIAPIAARLNALGLATMTDESGASIGKRYARADELGTPFAMTFDHQSLVDGAVTLRERDTTAQVRLPVADVPQILRALVDGAPWAEVTRPFAVVAASPADETGAAVAGSAPPSGTRSTTGGLTLSGTGMNATGAVGVTVEGLGRTAGRFARPADL